MPEYRTEIEIADDRYVCLQLPAYFPLGRAVVTVHLEIPALPDDPSGLELDPDRQDIEWWEEFEGNAGQAG